MADGGTTGAGGDLQTLIATLQLTNQQLGAIIKAIGTIANVSGPYVPIAGGTMTGPLTAPTLTVSGAASLSSPTTIKGVTDGSNAAAGNVGEYLTATASSISAASNVTVTICTLALTPGDWDVEGVVSLGSLAGTTCLSLIAAVNSSATIGSFGSPGVAAAASGNLGQNSTVPTGRARFSANVSQTIHLLTSVNFSGAGPEIVAGSVWARRMR